MPAGSGNQGLVTSALKGPASRLQRSASVTVTGGTYGSGSSSETTQPESASELRQSRRAANESGKEERPRYIVPIGIALGAHASILWRRKPGARQEAGARRPGRSARRRNLFNNIGSLYFGWRRFAPRARLLHRARAC